MKSYNIFFYLIIVVLIPSVADARVLFSDWGMSPNALMSATTPELENKSLACDINCSIVAEYSIFNEKMDASFWFDTTDKDKGGLTEIWLDSKKFKENRSQQQAASQQRLFDNFRDLYTKKFGEPLVQYRDQTMKVLGVATYIWRDRGRGNTIYLENWLQRVRLKYTSVKTGSYSY